MYPSFFGDKIALDNINLYVKKRRIRNDSRSFRMWKDYTFAPYCRFSDCFGRRNPNSRAGDYTNSAAQTTGKYRISEVCFVSSSECI